MPGRGTVSKYRTEGYGETRAGLEAVEKKSPWRFREQNTGSTVVQQATLSL